MTTFIEEARRYYEKEYDVTPLLLDVQSSFSSSITEIKPVFVALIDKLQNASPSKYWNQKTAHQVFDKLEYRQEYRHLVSMKKRSNTSSWGIMRMNSYPKLGQISMISIFLLK